MNASRRASTSARSSAIFCSQSQDMPPAYLNNSASSSAGPSLPSHKSNHSVHRGIVESVRLAGSESAFRTVVLKFKKRPARGTAMTVNFPKMVYLPCFGVFARPIIVRPVSRSLEVVTISMLLSLPEYRLAPCALNLPRSMRWRRSFGSPPSGTLVFFGSQPGAPPYSVRAEFSTRRRPTSQCSTARSIAIREPDDAGII